MTFVLYLFNCRHIATKYNYNQNQQQAVTQDGTGVMKHEALSTVKHSDRFSTGIISC